MAVKAGFSQTVTDNSCPTDRAVILAKSLAAVGPKLTTTPDPDGPIDTVTPAKLSGPHFIVSKGVSTRMTSFGCAATAAATKQSAIAIANLNKRRLTGYFLQRASDRIPC